MFRKYNHLNIDRYTHADSTKNIVDWKSTSGYITFVRGNLVPWRSKKLEVLALSIAEAEFHGMAKGLGELLWLRELVEEIGYLSRPTKRLFCDNKATIQIAQNPV